MKTKSAHHANENTFRFQTFHERLSTIHIDVARRLGKFASTPEDADTFFGEALAKWTDLNCTQHFIDFRKEIVHEVQSLTQLIHHQNEIVKALLDHLAVRNSLALQPLLDLVVQLARDLQADFYAHFERFFGTLVWLLNTYHHDVELLEQAFTCLSYLFKFLWRLMVKDIKPIYRLFSPLLSSQYKDYINNFAAESFAFLIRKEKDQEDLFNYMFMCLQDSPNQSEGTGRLLFETIKGIQKQFHSSTEKVLPMLLSKLHLSELPWQPVLDSLLCLFRSIAVYTTVQHSNCVWDPLLGCITQTHAEVQEAESAPSLEGTSAPSWGAQLEGQLQLLHVMLSHKDGALVAETKALVKVLAELLRSHQLSDACCDWLLKDVAVLLTAYHGRNMAPESRPNLLSLVYKSNFPEEYVFKFTRSLFDLPLMEKDLLPCLLQYCHTCLQTEVKVTRMTVVSLLTSLLLTKVPTTTEPFDLQTLRSFPLDFTPCIRSSKTTCHKVTLPATLLPQLEGSLGGQTPWHELWAAVLLLPHLRPLDPGQCADLLVKLVHNLTDHILQMTAGPTRNNTAPETQLGVLREAVFSLCRLQDTDQFIEDVPQTLVLRLLSAFPSSVNVLHVADAYYTQSRRSQPAAADVQLRLYSLLQDNLSSPFSQVRKLSLHVLCQCQWEMPVLSAELDLDQRGVFQICLDAECTPALVQTYRDKLMHLGKLSHDNVLNQVPVGPYQQVPLCYLIGALYVNFTLLWKPVSELIQSHAEGLPRAEFWEIYGKQLERASHLAEEELCKDRHPNKNKESEAADCQTLEGSNSAVSLEETFAEYCGGLVKAEDKADHVNWRRLLWTSMHLFPHLCEAKARILSPLLFQFMEQEYYPADLNVAHTQDIRKHRDVDSSDSTVADQPAGTDQSETAELDESQEGDTDQSGHQEGGAAPVIDSSEAVVGKKRRKAASRSLVVHLTLFSKFHSPKSVYMEPRLRALYFELLQHKDADVQGVAFQCLMTYKHKYLTPYRENFDRLLDDASFKNELVLFNIDQEASVVEDQHRQELVPVLMSILYGKMQTKTGKDTGGRTNSHVRKGIIMRFLASCQQHELKIFLDLIFEPFQQFVAGDLLKRLQEVCDGVDLAKVIPLRKLQGVLCTMEILFKKLGSLLETYLPNLLSILVCAAAMCRSILDRRQEVAVKAVVMVRAVRQLVQTRILEFFSSFTFYSFSNVELEAVFQSTIWPQLARLPQEGVYSPTPLLKLMHLWSSTPRYMCLLAKVDAETSLTPLPHVYQLLRSKTAAEPVVGMITALTENLLTMEDTELVDIQGAMDVGRTVEVDVGRTVEVPDTDTAYGTKLLLPHIPAILSHLRDVVCSMTKQKGKKRNIPVRELTILSRLSEFVEDKGQGAEVISLLLPFLGRKLNRAVGVEVDILTSVKHLLRLTDDPQQFLRPLAALFSVLSAKMTRVALCEVVQAIASLRPDTKTLADVVTKINAWDPKRLEEPDYLVRLQGFEEAQRLCNTTSPPDVTLLLMLMHNCSHFLATTEDMSLRDSSSYTVQEMVRALAKCQDGADDTFQTVISKGLLEEIKVNLKVKAEASRHEFINILACLVKNFPECNALRDLVKLTDEDLDMDFFANITHIQHHRRARAMRRLVRHLSTTKIRADTFVHYLLPIVTSFLHDDAFAKADNLHDTAVETIGAICRQLPWPRYLLLLKYYLHRLTQQLEGHKLTVRIVVSVLDSFHFDLTNSQGVSTMYTAMGDVRDSSDRVPRQTPGSDPEKKGKPQDQDNEDDELTVKDNEGGEKELSERECGDENSADVAEVPPGGTVVCAPGLATRIHRMIIRSILPHLHTTLTQKSKSDDLHKKAQAGKYAEDEEILRVPIALAVIKLLQALPKGMLEQNLPGILIKVCQFLKSRAQDIRTTARETLVKVMLTLGPKYFYFTIKELRSVLKRGYQVHVLCYTVWSLLRHLAAEAGLKTGDLDCCMDSLSEVFNEELFGDVAEEKEVAGIVGKLREARSSKSFDSYGIMAKFVSQSTLAKLVLPLKQVLEGTRSHKKARKVAKALRNISQGLEENKGLPLDALMTFIYALTNEAVPQINPRVPKKVEKKSDPRVAPPSTYLIKPDQPRGGSKPKMDVKTNMHIIVEFGLQILYQLLKKSTFSMTDKDHLQLLDPFVATLTSCLASKHIKVTSSALHCLLWVLKQPLPALRQHVDAIANHLFVLLSNYAVAGAARGDNFELVVMCFKAVTVLVRDVSYYTISTEQLQVLLGYAEQDIHDHSRQATAFSLLKAVLLRKLVVPEMAEVMQRLERLSITCEQPHVRLQCRQVVMQFLLDYPLGKKLKQHLEFYVTQLEYEYESGRESALEMLAAIFASFPQPTLVRYATLFFLPLCSRLVNDSSTKCRQLSGLAIKSLLAKLDSGERDKLFSITLQWLQDQKPKLRELAALSCGLFVEVETVGFERHLAVLLPIIEHQIHPDRFEQEVEAEEEERQRDHLLFQLLNLLLKVCRECSALRGSAWTEPFCDIWEHVQQHLLYPNTWVRLTSAQLFGLLFGAWSPQELVATSSDSHITEGQGHDLEAPPSAKKRKRQSVGESDSPTPREYLHRDFQEKVFNLCGVFVKQLASPQLQLELAEQVIKNLVFLAKVVNLLPNSDSTPSDGVGAPGGAGKSEADEAQEEGAAAADKRASLRWLLKRLGREAKMEVSTSNRGTLKRSSVFKFVAAVALDLGKERLPPYLPLMLPSLVRELTDATPNPDAELKRLCQEVVDLLKATAGVEVFTRHYATVQRAVVEKRQSRKADKALQVVSNPELSAKRKIKKNLSKRDAKKRKIQQLRPSKKLLKHRLKDLAFSEDAL